MANVAAERARAPVPRAGLAVVAAVVFCFVFAFIGAGFSEMWARVALFLIGTAVVGITCYYLGASLKFPSAVAIVVALTTAAILAWLYGSYAAHWLGWQGLEESDFGSDDLKGNKYIWIGLFFNLWFPAVAALAGVIVAFVGHATTRSRS